VRLFFALELGNEEGDSTASGGTPEV